MGFPRPFAFALNYCHDAHPSRGMLFPSGLIMFTKIVICPLVFINWRGKKSLHLLFLLEYRYVPPHLEILSFLLSNLGNWVAASHECSLARPGSRTLGSHKKYTLQQKDISIHAPVLTFCKSMESCWMNACSSCSFCSRTTILCSANAFEDIMRFLHWKKAENE